MMLNEMWYMIHNMYAGTIGWFVMGIVFAVLVGYIVKHRKMFGIGKNHRGT